MFVIPVFPVILVVPLISVYPPSCRKPISQQASEVSERAKGINNNINI